MIKLNENVKDICLKNAQPDSIKKVMLGENVIWERECTLFEEVEYIRNTSNAYINTGVAATNKTRIEATLKINSRTAQNVLFGSRDDTRVMLAVYINGNKYFAFAMRDVSDSTDWVSTGKWSANKLKFILDSDVSKSTTENNRGLTIYNMDDSLFVYKKPTQTINANPNATFSYGYKPMYIFTADPTNTGWPAKMDAFAYKIIDTRTNTLVRDYVPVRQCCTGIYGLLDKVENKFYTSPNGTKFTGGAGTGTYYTIDRNIHYDAELDWIATDGSAYIDTDYKPTNNTKFEIQMYIPTLDSSVTSFWPFGTRVADQQNQLALMYGVANDCWQWRYNTQNISSSAINFQAGNYIFSNVDDSNIIDINSTTQLTATEATFSCIFNFYIFTLNNAGNKVNIIPGLKLISAKIWEGETLVRDYIPVRVDQEGCLYDKVNERVYHNANSTGAFTYSQDKTLYMWLDGNDTPVSSKWIDKIGGLEWAITGATHQGTYYEFLNPTSGYSNIKYLSITDGGATVNIGRAWKVVADVEIANNTQNGYILDLCSYGTVADNYNGIGFHFTTTAGIAANIKRGGNTNTTSSQTTSSAIIPLSDSWNRMKLTWICEPVSETKSRISMYINNTLCRYTIDFNTIIWNNFRTSASPYNTIYIGRGFNNSSNYHSPLRFRLYDLKIYKIT